MSNYAPLYMVSGLLMFGLIVSYTSAIGEWLERRKSK
jgi:hypothetical protein